MNNNTLEFFVKMRDLMSGGLAKLAQNSKNTFSKIEGNIKAATTSSKYFKHSLDGLKGALEDAKLYRGATRLKSEFHEATREIQRLEREIDKMEGKNSRRGAKGGMGSFLKPLIPAIGLAGIMAFGASSIKAAMDFGGTKTSFGVLTGSKAVGDDLANKLRALKQDTIMGPTVYKNAQTMLGFGITAEKVVPDLKMLGDVSMGDADKLKRLTLAFSEVNAAGQLNGRRLLQFVNAGFNPLQEMSRTTGKSMEELAQMMKKGQITIGMLENAFKTATGPGGRFNNMLNTMAETPLGQLKKLEGQWAAFKIDVGEAILPMASYFMKAGTGVLSFLNIHKSIPTVLGDEKSSINALVTTITSLNISNEQRVSLMGKLKNSYPDLFGKIDTEKTTNSELLEILKNVNATYEDRIRLAESAATVSLGEKANKDWFELQQHAIQQLQYMKSGHDGFFDTGMFSPFMQGMDNVNIRNAGFDEKSTSGLEAFIKYSQKQMDDNQNEISFSKNAVQIGTAVSSIKDILAFSSDPTKMNAAFKGRSKDQDEFLKYIANWQTKGFSSGYNLDTLQKVQALIKGPISADKIKLTDEDGNDNKSTAKDKSIASGITGSGPRVININGVKFADKIELHAATGGEVIGMAEEKFQEMFLRVLNSGASVQ